MRRLIFNCMILVLTFIISDIAMAKDLRPHINDIIKNIQTHQLCGEYISGGGIYDKFIFGDGNKVTIDVIGMEFETTYFIYEKIVFILTDKQLVELAIESSTLLNGKDISTKDQSYARKINPKKTCASYSSHQEEKISLNNQLCFLSGIELKQNSDNEGAFDRFSECCNSGDGRSCMQYAFLTGLFRNDQETEYKYYRKACDLGYGKGCHHIAGLELARGKIKTARQLYDEACAKQHKESCIEASKLESSAQNGKIFFNSGKDLLREGQYDKAISEFNLAIKSNSKHFEAFNSRGIAYFRKGLIDLAIADYNKAIELNPKGTNAYFNRGVAWFEKGNYDRAISNYNKLINLDPKDAEAYYRRGMAWHQKGNYNRSCSDFHKGCQLGACVGLNWLKKHGNCE